MKKQLTVIGVPFALGGEELGPARGPDAFVRYGLLEHLRAMDIAVDYVDLKRVSLRGDSIFGLTPDERGPIYSEALVQEMRILSAGCVFDAHQLGHIPVILGGDHSISLGTLPEYLHPKFSLGRKVGLLWIDAHYDAHTDMTSPSHHANGMPLATVLGHGKRSLGRPYLSDPGTYGAEWKHLSFDPSLVLHIGAGESDCEPEEIALLDKLKVKRVTMKDIRGGNDRVFLDPLEDLLSRVDDLIVTFDLDAVHGMHAPAVSFVSKNGMIPYQLYMLAGVIRRSEKLRQLEIMEYNPDFEAYRDGQPVTIAFVKRFCSHLFNRAHAP